MDFAFARNRILEALTERGRAPDAELLALVDGDRTLLADVRRDLLAEALASEWDGGGLSRLDKHPSPRNEAFSAELSAAENQGSEKSESHFHSDPFDAAAPGGKRPRVFLSYGRGDASSLANRLRDELEGRGFTVWRDVEDIRAGQSWEQEIVEGIRQSDVVVALVTPHAVRRRNDGFNTIDNRDSVCLDEISQARFGDPPRPVIPLRGLPCEIPFALFRFHCIDLCGWEKNDDLYRNGVRQLVQAIEESVVSGPPRKWWDDELRPWDFSAFLYEKRRDFCGREWLFDELDAWCTAQQAERALLIVGNPGTGKSAIVAELTNRDVDGRIIGFHCCQADAEQTLEPWRFIRSLAAMIASRVEPFAEALRSPRVKAALSEANCKDDPVSSFENGILGPLETIGPPDDGVRLLLVDGLDEALTHRAASFNIVSLLATRVERLPKWLRLVATTRKDPAVLNRLQGLRARELDAQDPRNLKDIEAYVTRRLESPDLVEHLHSAGTTGAAVAARLLERSEGNFLYVRQALDGIARHEFQPDRLDSLPPGLFGFYQGYFERQFPDEASYAPARKVLQIITAAQEPLSPAQLAEATGMESRDELPGVLRQLSVYLPNRPDADGRPFYAVFHKSLADWLTAPELRGSMYSINRVAGHETLADLCWSEYRKGMSSVSPYALSHLPTHLAATGRWELLEQVLTSLDFLEAKTNAGLAVDLMMDLRRAVEVMPAGRPHRRILRLLGEAIHRDVAFLSRHPTTLFQCLWNQCWWYDCPEAAQHYDDPRHKKSGASTQDVKQRTWAGSLLHENDTWRASAAETVADDRRRKAASGRAGERRSEEPIGGAGNTVPWYRRGTKLFELLERWRREKELAIPDFCWLRSLRPPPIPLGTGLLAQLNSHESSVNHIAVSPDGSRLASVSDDGALCLWNPDRGQLLARIIPPRTPAVERPIPPVAPSPTPVPAPDPAPGAGQAAASPRREPPRAPSPAADLSLSSSDARWGAHRPAPPVSPVPPPPVVPLQNAGIEHTVQTFVFREPVRPLAAVTSTGPAPPVLVPGAVDGPPGPQATLLPVAPHVREAVHEPGGGAASASLAEIQRTMDSGAAPSIVRTMSAAAPDWSRDRSLVSRVLTRPALTRVAFSPEGRWMVCGGRDGVIRVCNVDDIKDARALKGAHSHEVVGLAWLQSGDRFLTLDRGGTAALWDAATFLRTKWTLENPPGRSACLAIVPDSSRILIGADSGEVVACDAATSNRVVSVHREDVAVTALHVSPNGRRVACGLANGRIVLVDLMGGQVTLRLSGHSESVRSVAFSPNGRQLVSGSADGTVRLWDATSGEPLVCQRVQDFSVNDVAWMPDNRRFVSAAAADRDESIDDESSQAPLAFPVAVWDGEGARTSAEEGGDLILRLRGHQRMVDALAFSADGERLVTGGADRTLRVWDARIGSELRCLTGHDRFQSVAWSPDARIISTTTTDGMFGVWDVEGGRQLFFLYGPDFPPGTVAHLQDDQRIVYGKVVGGRERHFWRAEGFPGERETIVRAVLNDEIVVGLPLALRRISIHPSGRIWAGASGNHVHLFALEGATRDEPTLYEPDVPPRIDKPVDAPIDAIIVKWKDFEYSELSKLGEGGMGLVYEARQTSTNRRVAVKTLKNQARKDQSYWRKFFLEAVITSRLDHPNIVPIYDLGIDETGRLFYSMKRIRGHAWSRKIQTLPLVENLEILLRVCDAIAYAHDLGVVHRDIKPENVMLGDFGEVFVVDWGLAMTTENFPGTRHLSQTTSMGGTPAYMAPEMVTGPVARIGPWSDVYLLGAVLYEIVTGQPPHVGKTAMQCLMEAASNRIRPTDKSGELVDVALRSLATDPSQRHANVAAFQAALRNYRTHADSHALADRAQEDLTRAREAGDELALNRSVFAFHEALQLWPANERARTGLDEASLDFAQRAIAGGNYELAASVLDASRPRHVPLLNEINAAPQRKKPSSPWYQSVRRWFASKRR